MQPREPRAVYADLFRRRSGSLVELHGPGRVRFTWNARAALYQLLEELPRSTRSTVLVPAFHCMALVRPILAAGFEVDCYRVCEDFTIDLEDLAQRMRADVAAVLVVHYFGFPADVDGAARLAKAGGAWLIEDCSHAFLTSDRGKPLGQRGDYAVFSYYKCVPSVVGGALVANGSAPLPGHAPAAAPWPARLMIRQRWLKQAGERGRGPAASVFQRLLAGVARRGLARRTEASNESGDAAREARLPAGFLDEPYLFHPSLARAAMPGWTRRVVEASRWAGVAAARRRNYASYARLIADTAALHRPLPELPDGVVPYLFPVLFEGRRRHEAAMREAGIPYLRFGEILHEAVEGASAPARREARGLSDALLLLPVHQDLDDRHVADIAHRLIGYAAQHD